MPKSSIYHFTAAHGMNFVSRRLLFLEKKMLDISLSLGTILTQIKGANLHHDLITAFCLLVNMGSVYKSIIA